VTDGPREILTISCPTCAGDGIVVSVETHAVDAERELRRLVRTSRHQAFHIELAADVAPLLVGPGAERLVELERETGRRFFLESRDGVAGDHFVVLDRGPVSKLEPKKLPVAAGDELDLKLVEPHPVLPGAAVGRLNGYTVAVADARNLLGKSTRVRIERATPGAAYAVVAGAAGSEAPVDAGEELEREDGSALPQRETPKPRSRGSRGGSRRKSASAKPAAEVEPAAEAAGEPEPADAVAETPAGPDTETPGEEKPKKKRTRRGSRGGRGRKKKTAATVSQDGASPEAAPGDGAAPAEPGPEPAVEPDAVPEGASANGDGEGAAEEPKKKKTRRGSRGGRNRRKKPPTAAPTGDGPEPVTAIAAEEEPRLD